MVPSRPKPPTVGGFITITVSKDMFRFVERMANDPVFRANVVKCM